MIETTYQVNEIFTSVQGEGILAGKRSTFIRLQGCPVGCPWCDSVRTWGPGRITNDYCHGYVFGFGSTLLPTTKEVFDAVKVINNQITSSIHDVNSYEYKRGYIAGLFDVAAFQDSTSTHINIRFRVTPDVNGQVLKDAMGILKQQSISSWMSDDEMELYINDHDAQTFIDYFQPRVQKFAQIPMRRNGVQMTLKEIGERIDADHVIITGGEPILYDLDPLLRMCLEKGVSTQIETSGLNDFKGHMRPGWITWSPKQNLDWKAPDTFVANVHEIKFVVDAFLTLETVGEVVANAIEQAEACDPHFVLMAEGSPPDAISLQRTLNLLHECEQRYPDINWRFGARLQYYLGVR